MSPYTGAGDSPLTATHVAGEVGITSRPPLIIGDIAGTMTTPEDKPAGPVPKTAVVCLYPPHPPTSASHCV